MLTPSNIVLHLNKGDPARLFVTNKIQASKYPIHCNAILLAVGAIGDTARLSCLAKRRYIGPVCLGNGNGQVIGPPFKRFPLLGCIGVAIISAD
jgi:hypothetical protein